MSAACSRCSSPLESPSLTRAGELICPECHRSVPPCRSCHGKGKEMHGRFRLLVNAGPCMDCGGTGDAMEPERRDAGRVEIASGQDAGARFNESVPR